MRVYLPSTLPRLARLVTGAEVTAGPGPVRGYAVTPALRESYASGDDEELEYVAMLKAARESLRLLHADPQAPPRRVVLAVEVAEEQVSGGGDDMAEPAVVEVTGSIAIRDLISGHIDDPGAGQDVRAAVAALHAADAGDENAKFTVDGAEGHELLWYATQELSCFGVP
jgi:hypothetical protein